MENESPNAQNFFTSDYCAITFGLAELFVSLPATVLEEIQHAYLCQSYSAWINAHALTHGVPELAVSENSLSRAWH